MKVIERIVIEASSPVVFAYLMNVENRKNYIPALEEVIMIDPPPIRKGSRYTEVAEIAGRRLETTYQVVGFEQDKLVVARTLKSIFPIQASLQLDPDNGDTELIILLDFKLGGIFRLASGIVQGIVSQQAKTILSKIKTNIEVS